MQFTIRKIMAATAFAGLLFGGLAWYLNDLFPLDHHIHHVSIRMGPYTLEPAAPAFRVFVAIVLTLAVGLLLGLIAVVVLAAKAIRRVTVLPRSMLNRALAASIIAGLIVSTVWLGSRYIRAQLRFDAGMAVLPDARFDEAIVEFREAIRLRPGFASAYTQLGFALDRQGNVAEGVAMLRQAIRFDPSSAAAHVALGDALARLGKPDEAISEYRIAIRSKNASDFTGQAFYAMARIMTKQGKLEEAILAFKDAIAAGVSDEKVHYDLIDAEHARQKAEKALAEYQNAVETQPADVALHKNLMAVVLLHQGKLNEAATALRESIRLRPEFGDAHFNLARVFFLQEKLLDARSEFREAIRLDPAHAEAHTELERTLNRIRYLYGAVPD